MGMEVAETAWSCQNLRMRKARRKKKKKKKRD
jgi:hypothetical protein